MNNIGFLIYDDVANRFAISTFDDQQTIELHCGDCVAIKIKGNFVKSRIEIDSDDELYGWYFAGLGRCAPYIGHTVELQ